MSTTTARRARHAGASAAQSDWIERAGRVGLVAKAVSYAIIGVLALQIPLGQGGQAADRQGVLRQVATESWGTAALIALAVGFAAYAIWRFADALFDRQQRGRRTPRAWPSGPSRSASGSSTPRRRSPPTRSSGPHRRTPGGNEQQETARVLDWPAGRWIVLAAAVGVHRRRSLQRLPGLDARSSASASRKTRCTAPCARGRPRSGVVGHIARGVVFAIIGVFLGKAAIEYDPYEAVGIDGALLKLVEQPFGKVLLGLVAAGLVAYAVYCLVEARYRRI